MKKSNLILGALIGTLYLMPGVYVYGTIQEGQDQRLKELQRKRDELLRANGHLIGCFHYLSMELRYIAEEGKSAQKGRAEKTMDLFREFVGCLNNEEEFHTLIDSYKDGKRYIPFDGLAACQEAVKKHFNYEKDKIWVQYLLTNLGLLQEDGKPYTHLTPTTEQRKYEFLLTLLAGTNPEHDGKCR